GNCCERRIDRCVPPGHAGECWLVAGGRGHQRRRYSEPISRGRGASAGQRAGGLCEPGHLAAPGAPGYAERLVARLEQYIPKELLAKLEAARSRSVGERRRVTVPFCDVQGSAAVAEQLDPGEWAED